MNENLRFQVADEKAKTLTAALGISDERHELLTTTIRGYIKDDQDAAGDMTKMRGIDGVMAAISEICETPQELGFVCYAFGNYVEHAKHCPFHGPRHSDDDDIPEDIASILAEAIFGGRRKTRNPNPFGGFGQRSGNSGVHVVRVDMHKSGGLSDALHEMFGKG